MNLQEFNELDEATAMEKLLFCCGSTTWASILNSTRPFNDLEELCDTADREWWKLSHDDWREAFAAHPK
jgi:2-oxo-4-hydroxy-4-carboxy-5-ureidoimidazoline decarboxylase